jgi:3-deoxy-D-manno-octulosonic-acid transferase
MALSIGRRLYNLTARRSAQAEHLRPARPRGPLVWLHAPKAEVICGLAELAQRLIVEDGVAVLMTCDEMPERSVAGAIRQAPPADQSTEIASFLDYWRPDLLVMSEGEVRPTLLHELADRRLPSLIADARAPYLLRGREGWYPGLLRGALACVGRVLAVDETAARAFRKAGAPRVEVVGRMEEQSAALPCQEAERSALAQLMATRPIWLAAGIPESEEAAVIAAHRAALRLAHRLLLILVPADPARAPLLAAQMEAEEGWTVAQRGLEQEPDTETEVYIPDSSLEFGLWYRLAPVTFLGGSLAGDGCLRNPMEPAALGSAILYGPRPGSFGAAFGRLGAARAARAVASHHDLAEALSDLLSPDRAARLAQAAWGVASDGAEVTDRVLDILRATMDGET